MCSVMTATLISIVTPTVKFKPSHIARAAVNPCNHQGVTVCSGISMSTVRMFCEKLSHMNSTHTAGTLTVKTPLNFVILVCRIKLFILLGAVVART